MKKVTIYISALFLLGLAACNKEFLNTEDVTTASDQNFYKTPNDAFKALVGAYDGLQRVWSDGIALPVAAEVLSDNTFGGTGNSDGFGYQMMDEFDKLRSPSDQNLFGANWGLYYNAIFRCNMLLAKLNQIDWTGQTAAKQTYEAEARFLRAFMYFDMVRLWGNIPLVVAPTSSSVPQANPDEVYKLIAEDLKFAADNLPSTSRASQSTATYGRGTKWAAEAMIGRVFLYYTGYYGKPDLVGVITKSAALAYQEDIISKGGFELVENFANLWPAASVNNYAGEDNKETVFTIKYTYTGNYNGNIDGNEWLVMFGMREQSSSPYGNGWGAATVNPRLYNAYQATDTRRNATIISIADENIDFQKKANQREYTGFYIKKYTPMADSLGNSLAVKMGGVDFQIGQFQDYVSVRYADVLLMAAELGSANAQKYFDDVRKRAYRTSFTSLTVSQQNIMNERRLEFALEGIRYWDLLRQGINVAASAIAETTTVQNGGANTTKTITAAKIQETKGLQQIPYTQITLSANVLKQNPGW